jgi:hypothetical protein
MEKKWKRITANELSNIVEGGRIGEYKNVAILHSAPVKSKIKG